MTQLRRPYLLTVARADGGEKVGEEQPALQEIDLAVELDAGRCEQLPVKAQPREDLRPKDALIAKIVYGEHRADALKEWIASKQRFQIHRDQGGLPVVSMHRVGLEREGAARLEGCQAKQAEPFRVVGVILPGRGLIQTIAVERGIVTHKIDPHPAWEPSFQDVHRPGSRRGGQPNPALDD